MTIKKVKWKEHPILGNLELDLINYTTGKPFETVIFAGDNGVGKTTILETISTFLNIGSFEYFDFIEYNAAETSLTAVQPSDNSSQIKDFFDIVNDANTIKIRTNRANNFLDINSNILDIRHYGCVFSKARADYKTQQITSTKTNHLDTEKYDNDKEDDFTFLKQLIIDIQNQDNSDYVDLNKGIDATFKKWNEFYPSSKIYRFKNAFDNFFDTLTYEKVIDNHPEKIILFNKNGKAIPIDKLSTGEKQIVFRGIYLLKNYKQLNGASIMVDEPELSMHPKWQKNILKYYKDLFTESGNQKVQLFIATHSEYVLEEALSNKDNNLIIVLNDLSGVIQAKRIDIPSVLPSITSAETNYLAFDIVSIDYHIQLYGYLQEKMSLNSVRRCDAHIKSQSAFDPSIHGKVSVHPHGAPTYYTLSTYIRNAIDHPGPSKTFTESQLRTSIELLIELCR
jgi:predicted ATP-binding protein involved in virulence